MILSSNDTANQISFLILKDFESTNLARTLNALVGVFRFETDVGRRETLLVTVDVAVVQTGDARWRRTAAEIRWRKRRNWNVLVRIQRSWTCRRCRRGCQFSIDDGLFFNRNDLIPLINYYSIIMLLCISNGEEIHGISAGLCFSPLGFSISIIPQKDSAKIEINIPAGFLTLKFFRNFFLFHFFLSAARRRLILRFYLFVLGFICRRLYTQIASKFQTQTCSK